MFNFFGAKQRKLLLYAPVKGSVLDLAATPDEVFRSGMMGDGFAVEPAEGVVVAPCDGEIVVMPRTGHAVALRSPEGVEVLIHVGLDTVELGGQGFTVHARPGDKVKRGDRLLTFDREFIRGQGKQLVTPVVITNMADKVERLVKYPDRADGVILEVTVK